MDVIGQGRKSAVCAESMPIIQTRLCCQCCNGAGDVDKNKNWFPEKQMLDHLTAENTMTFHVENIDKLMCYSLLCF